MKKIIISLIGIVMVISLLLGGCAQKEEEEENIAQDEEMQTLLGKTYTISKEYVALRYMTDEVLINAETYDYDTWNDEVTLILERWDKLDQDSLILEELGEEMAEEKVSLHLVTPAYAYSYEEINYVIDHAPAGRRVATLAKFLNVDAKRAFKILQNIQYQEEADAWNEAGDTFQKLETSATVIKDGCKVAGFVGGVVISGGTSAIAAGSTLTQAAVIVSGADLALEVTSDGANIALGNNNKVSAIVDTVRKGTEPVASILTIANLPNNLSSGFDKFNGAILAIDQGRSTIQEGKIIGISLPSFSTGFNDTHATIASLNPDEVQPWLQSNGATTGTDTVADVTGILGVKGNNYNRPHKPQSIATPSGTVKQDVSGIIPDNG